MSIGIRDEHEELRSSLQRWVDARCGPEVTRAALDADADVLPEFWAELGAQGTLGIHIDEAVGGQGAGMVELAVTAEVLGRAAAPGVGLGLHRRRGLPEFRQAFPGTRPSQGPNHPADAFSVDHPKLPWFCFCNRPAGPVPPDLTPECIIHICLGSEKVP